MINRILQIILFLGLFIICNIYTYGQDYEIKNITIEASGDPFSARDRALSDGQRISLEKLIEKLSTKKISLPTLTDSEISKMVKDFEFLSEKMTSRYYKAVVNFSFDKESIDKLLGNVNTSTSEDRESHLTLIIPIFIRGTKTIIWQDYNYWELAIDKEINKLSLENKYIMPIGELDDIDILSDELMAKGDYNEFYPIIRKYNAKEVIIAINHYLIDPKTNYPTIILNLRYINNHGQKTIEKFFSFKEGGSLHNLLSQVANFLLNNKYSDINEMKSTKTNNIVNASLLIKDLDDWLYMKKKLIDLCGENNLIIKKLLPTKVILQINTSNILGNISNLLKNAEIKVENKEGDLILSRHHKVE